MDAKIFRVNYKSDFILTLTSDAGWMTPFCIKFWTGSPMLAYYASYDGETYTHCTYDPSEPTKLTVQFDDHHLPIGNLKYQVAYHFTVADFPENTEDEVTNQANVTTVIDGDTYQVMLDLNGETAPEIQFALPAYANELQRIQNEQTRITQEQQRINQEQTRINQEAARVTEFNGIKTEASADHQRANEDHSRAQTDHQNALADRSQAASDHSRAQSDHSTADSDHLQANSDHTRAQSDHNTALSDHQTALSDHTQANSDHTRAKSDHTRAMADSSTAAADHRTASTDHTQANTDHTRAESDHQRVETDLAEVEEFSNSLGAYDISAANATGSTLATYPDLATALGTNGSNIPEALRKGGMSVKFVLTYDNNSSYVQYRLMKDSFSTAEADWQGVDSYPIGGSRNLVESSGMVESEQKLFLQELVGAVYSTWNTTAGQTHFVIPVNGSETIRFENAANSLYYGFLKSYATPVNGETPDFCTGYEGRQNSYESSPINVPSDCRFFVINNPTGNYALSSLKINGIEVINGVHGAIANIGKKIIDTEGDIQTLGGNVQTLENGLQTLDGETVKDSDLTITSVNLANPSNIDDGHYINNKGNISENADWSLISVPVTAGSKYTFGGFYLGRNGYYAFYNGSTKIDAGVEYVDPNGRQHPVTATAPENATLLYIDIKTAKSPSDAYSNMMINVGETLLDYMPYKGKVTAINNTPLTGTDDVKIKEIEDDIDSLQDDVLELQSQMAGNIEDLVADLPVSDGTGVSVGYAYIDSTTGVVKVKLQ